MVVHTAALVSNSIADADMWRVNVLATRNLIAAAEKHNVRPLCADLLHCRLWQ